MKCSSKYTSDVSRGHLAADRLGDAYSMSVPHCYASSLLSLLHQRELRPKPVELSPTLLGPPPSSATSPSGPTFCLHRCRLTGKERVGAPPASSAAALCGRSARGAAGLRRCSLMGKECAGRRRPLPPLPYGEGETTATSASGHHRRDPEWWVRV
jgi:hypothetical protein